LSEKISNPIGGEKPLQQQIKPEKEWTSQKRMEQLQ
jgi:hypothetical protein